MPQPTMGRKNPNGSDEPRPATNKGIPEGFENYLGDVPTRPAIVEHGDNWWDLAAASDKIKESPSYSVINAPKGVPVIPPLIPKKVIVETREVPETVFIA